jgi:epoxyqueuosine reductase
MDYNQKDWQELTESTFETIFKNSAVKRTRYKGLKRNLSFLKR